MNYYKLLDEKAKLGLEKFKHELDTNSIFDGLLWTLIDENEYGETEIVIETFDRETYDTEFLTSYEFNKSGDLID